MNRRDIENIQKLLPKYFWNKLWFDVPFATKTTFHLGQKAKQPTISKHGTDDDSRRSRSHTVMITEHCRLMRSRSLVDRNEVGIQDLFESSVLLPPLCLHHHDCPLKDSLVRFHLQDFWNKLRKRNLDGRTPTKTERNRNIFKAVWHKNSLIWYKKKQNWKVVLFGSYSSFLDNCSKISWKELCHLILRIITMFWDGCFCLLSYSFVESLITYLTENFL